ncbi:MAG: molybdopterin molybdotransferase MoeA [Defluviitaleaceae bacterium]|nr:molybdopterin molybdotransferase MoeA [Defluviitaleaceae bacterium]
MRFLQVDTVEAAQAKLLEMTKGWVDLVENIPLSQAFERVLTRDIFAKEDLPHFRRSTVDGYAVLASDTHGAGEAIPSFLKVIGGVEMGKGTNIKVTSGQCVEMPTGGVVPCGSDAIVMVEYTEELTCEDISIYKPVAAGDHIIQIGDDIKKDALLLSKGKKLTAQDIGALATMGVAEVEVFARPKIALISTGDELLHPHNAPLQDGKIRESNTLSLGALAKKYGYEVVETHVLADDEELIRNTIKNAMERCHIVAVSGGSSQGKKDMTADIIGQVATPGVLTHGIAIKPGKPTILGHDEASNTILAGLPGHPISCMVVFEILFGGLMTSWMGVDKPFGISASLTQSVPQSPGKLTFYPCRLEAIDGKYVAEPIFAKSGLIANLCRANGYFLIDKDTEGIAKGESVNVYPF